MPDFFQYISNTSELNTYFVCFGDFNNPTNRLVKMAGKGYSLAAVFTHYELPECVSGIFKAKCKHCASIISGCTKVTTNFTRHLKRKHPLVECGKPIATKESDQRTITSFVNPAKKYGQKDQHQLQITNALVSFVAGDLMPLSIVESSNFQALVHSLDPHYQMPSRKHLSSTLVQQKCSEVENDVIKQLQLAQYVSVTIDLWSNRQMRAYIGITGHFILNWSMKSVMLACKRFRGKHTADMIAQQYDATLAHFGVAHKITNIVTDNASNMLKAFSLPGFASNGPERVCSDDEDDDDSESEEADCEPEIEGDVTEYLTTQHQGCFAHTLQLVIKDGFKDAGQINKVLAKCSSIVAHVRKSIHASELMEDEIRLQTANATRWNSQLKMVRSVLKVSQEKLARLNAMHLTAYDRNILSDLIEILTPFEDATDFVQNEKSVSASFVLPCVKGLKAQLSAIHPKYLSKFLATLKTALSTRMQTYEESETYTMAAILDPRFRLQWCTSTQEKLSKKADLCLLVNQLESADTTEKDDQPPPSKRSRLFSFMEEQSRAQVGENIDADDEVNKYLFELCSDETIDPLEYWKVNSLKYQKLTQLAVKFLAVPASSAPVERLFSIAGKVFRPERCRLTDKLFERLMFIRCNSVSK